MKLYIGEPIEHSGTPFCGALGAFVTAPNTDQVGLISAAHVIANQKARRGDTLTVDVNTNTGLIKRAVARLDRRAFNNHCDAAIAWLEPGIQPYFQVPHLNTEFTAVRDPKVGDILTKIGGRSGLRRGRVTAIGDYPTRYDGEIKNVRAMYLEPLYETDEHKVLSENGDCGSVWFDANTGAAVGLHFAGESFSAYGPLHAKACFLSTTLDQLQVSLCTAQCVEA
ncbi:hypothetical protein [Halioxenophilus aromaticivorans]|uniref:Serine protease n=1 Tax=Halioxenophilus aromaticivorans TaxID=1306992 RepID=A0AAV3U4X8_9ALTE